MYSLSEIVYSASPKYLQYFSRKTGFLISDFPLSVQNNVRWLWRHLSRCFDFENQMALLSEKEKERFFELLYYSGYSAHSDELNEGIEKKIPWVFNHPTSGIFIPLEIIKLLMKEEIFFKHNYLFSLLYRLKLREQKNFASLLGGTLEGQVSLTFEKNPLDMALVLYIWLIDTLAKIENIEEIIPQRGRILQGPFTFAREIKSSSPKKNIQMEILPKEPVDAWDFLYTHFPHQKEDLDKLYTLINRGNKGFYRSLALLKNQQGDLLTSFKTGVLIPVISPKDSKSINRLKITSPKELHFFLNEKAQRPSHSEYRI